MRIDWQAKGIDITKVRGGKAFCPKCHHTRKNKSDRSLSIDVNTGLYNCHNTGCDFSGSAAVFEQKREYTKPLPRLQKVSDGVLAMFEKRGISNNTLLYMKVTSSTEWMPGCDDGGKVGVICFNYYRDEELVNIKYRSQNKTFRMEKGAELIFYNLNATKIHKTIVIVEGEIDCLAMIECGITNVVSVPNGASLSKTAKLEYLDNCWMDFEQLERVVLSVDGDEAGEALKNELIRRLGRDRCCVVTYPEGCKDANEVLIKYGKEAVKKLVDEAKDLPIEGVDTVYDKHEALNNLYHKGYPETKRIDYGGLNDILRWRLGEVTTITGTPNAGKSTWLSNVLEQFARLFGWKCGMFTPEKQPTELLIMELSEIYIGKPFYRKNPNEKMSVDELVTALNFIDEHFFFLRVDEVNTTIDGLISKAKELVKKNGINVFVTDPWNYIEHQRPAGMSETEYVSLAYTAIKTFAKEYNVHWFVVAHPTKIKKKQDGTYEVPTLYDISGSAHFFNKTDNGIVLYRDYVNNCNIVYVQKVRWFFVGTVGSVQMYFDTHCQRFTETPVFRPIAAQVEEPFKPYTGINNYYEPKEKITEL